MSWTNSSTKRESNDSALVFSGRFTKGHVGRLIFCRQSYKSSKAFSLKPVPTLPADGCRDLWKENYRRMKERRTTGT